MIKKQIVIPKVIRVKRALPFYLFTLLLFLFSGCKEDVVSSLFTDDEGMRVGDAVLFSTYMPGRAVTRGETQEEFKARMEKYVRVGDDYEFTIKMFQQGTTDALQTGTYTPIKTVTVENEGQANETTTTTYEADGTLQPTAPLYWPDKTGSYGFEVTAGSETIATNQFKKEDFLKQDLLHGYGFEPIWDSDETKMDKEDALNYRTMKQWYDDNKATKGLAPGAPTDLGDKSDWYKKIPLYLRHQRALVTIRLKAGEGVDRNILAYELAKENIHTDIYSYGDLETDNKTILSFPSATTVDYSSSDYGGEASKVATTEFSAIVEPHNYFVNPTTEKIAEIRLSGQRYTFYASNDIQYGAASATLTEPVEPKQADYKKEDPSDPNKQIDDKEAYDAAVTQYNKDKTAYEAAVAAQEPAKTHMQNYNVEAGRHLVITATLGRESRKIVITAYVEDWTETVTTSIVDDYGQAGDPIQITTRQELYDFLISNKNKAGNVAIIVPNELNLEKNGDTAADWAPQPLNCTLNLAGAVLSTNHQVFSTISSSGNLVNGTIRVGNAELESAVAETNEGHIERVHVEAEDATGKKSTGKATRGGLVVTNYGSILNCNSELPVQGHGTMVGGIAARSVYKDNASTMPVIDGCTVNARVDGTNITEGEGDKITVKQAATGAGIVCEAEGRVTNNTFVYGRTLMQDATNFKNTIHHKYTRTAGDTAHELRAYGNAWPTSANANGNGIPATNTNATPEDERYYAVIDSQEEMTSVFSIDQTQHNLAANKIRLSNDITLNNWTFGSKSDVYNTSANGNVFCQLDGNGHTITTDGMLFSNIVGVVENLTVELSGDLTVTAENGYEAIAALGYRVLKYGDGDSKSIGRISNIFVKGGTHKITAPTAAGVVVWAMSGATVENCQCKAIITSNFEKIGDTRIYCGGIVANAAQATITRCVFHSTSDSQTNSDATANADATLYRATTDTSSDSKVFFGGILGGTAPANNNAELPSVLITDCTSWFSPTNSTSVQKGAVVGYAQYADAKDSNKFYSGIATGCEGNWWNLGSQGIGTWLHTAGSTDEQIIGKRNAVKPTQDDGY